ncbi:P1 family peptidase [uncultured Thiodictyon sp.]|jgi:L-aminopeptidase/D-esterase-like protein|uniref:P1 family peptidase n=1 Tax=uncultured Thiodictyon sp. TaxID=1846217 RepID=UPI0025D83F05|nr:P1 family peptidase [uncultured Thiodictyon sp.]
MPVFPLSSHRPAWTLLGALCLAGAPVCADESALDVNATLTAVSGLRVASHTLAGGTTGCTVVVIEGDGAPGGVAQRGGAPGTRETDLLHPLNEVDRVNAIVLSGGSAFGLDAATGTVRWLREQGMGWDTGLTRVPIVPSAVLYDLPVGNNVQVQPGADCGYQAAAAAKGAPVEQGSVGAGAGATVGKLGRPMRGGLGSFAYRLPNGLMVAALVATNALGDIIDPDTSRVVAGARDAEGKLLDARQLIRHGILFNQTIPPRAGVHTTIGVVATNARLNKTQVDRMALMADDGYARAIVPVHTMYDGDTVFALATGSWDGDANLTLIGAMAAEAMARALVAAVEHATSLPGIPAAGELPGR